MNPSIFSGSTNILGSLAPQMQQQPQIAQPEPEQSPVPAHKGNFLTHALPTIGGILGGIGGGLVTGGLGGIAGGAGGSAAGKALENKLEGNSIGSGVLSNAVQGGVGEGVGGAIGKAGGAVLKAVGGKSEKVATNLVKGQVSKNAITQEGADALRTLGATDARQWQPIANAVTGTGGALNSGLEKGLMTSGQGIDVGGLIGSKMSPTGMVDDLLANETAVNPAAHNKVLASVNKAVQTMMGGSQGMIGKQLADSLDVLQQSRMFAKLGAKAQDVAHRTGNAEQQGVADVYRNLSDELNGRIFRPAGQPIPLTDEVKSEIIHNLGTLKNINPTVHTNLVKQVGEAQTLEDLRGLQAPFVQGSKAIATSERAADRGAGTNASGVVSSLPTAGAMAAGPHGMIAGILANTIKTPTADRAMIPLVQHGGSIMSSIGNSGVPAGLGGALGVGAATSNNLIQDNGNMGDNMQDPMLSGTPAAQPQPPVDPAKARALMEMAFFAPGALSALTPNATQQANVSGATGAETALNSLGHAPGAGILSSLQAHLGVGAAGAYQKNAASVAQQVGTALGVDPEVIEKQLTNYREGGGNIDSAIQDLLNRLKSVVTSNQNTGLQGLLGFNGSEAPQSVTAQLPSAVQ